LIFTSVVSGTCLIQTTIFKIPSFSSYKPEKISLFTANLLATPAGNISPAKRRSQ
jgi:hypothetical protein